MKNLRESMNMMLEGQSSFRDIQDYVESWIRNTSVHGRRPELDTEAVLKAIVKSMIRGMKDNLKYEDSVNISELEKLITELEKTNLSK